MRWMQWYRENEYKNCKDCEWFQAEAGSGKIDEDGSVLALKSARHRGRHGHPDWSACKHPASIQVLRTHLKQSVLIAESMRERVRDLRASSWKKSDGRKCWSGNVVLQAPMMVGWTQMPPSVGSGDWGAIVVQAV